MTTSKIPAAGVDFSEEQAAILGGKVVSHGFPIELKTPANVQMAHDVFSSLHERTRSDSEESLYLAACLSLEQFFRCAPLFCMELPNPADLGE